MLLTCVAYQAGKKVADIEIKEIGQHLAVEDGFVWVAMKDPKTNDLDEIAKQFNIHELALEDGKKGHQRPKLDEYGESLFVVIPSVELNADFSLNQGEIDLFVGSNYVLSVRHKTEKGFANVRARCEREPELFKIGPGFVLYALLDTVVDRYFPVIDELERQLESFEEKIFSHKATTRFIVEEIYEFKGKIMILQHTVASLLEVLSKLYGGRVPRICNQLQEYFRDVSDHLIRINKSVENLRELTTTAMQVNLSMISLNNSEVTKKLASYGALFALPTMIAGVYGMNFKFMPELEWIWGYPLSIVFMILLNILLWWKFKKIGWL